MRIAQATDQRRNSSACWGTNLPKGCHDDAPDLDIIVLERLDERGHGRLRHFAEQAEDDSGMAALL